MITRFLATRAIRGYQKWISPHKGFCCAHHVMNGDGTCSQYGLVVFEEHPFFDAWRRLRERFDECREANATYHAMTDEERRKKRRQQQGSNDSSSSGSDCGCSDIMTFLMIEEMMSGCSSGAAGCGDGIGACEIGSCEVGACD